MMKRSHLFVLIAAAALAAAVPAQQKQPDKKKPDAAPKAAEKAPEKKPGDLKKYDEVITKEAKSQTGMFKVHRVGDKLYWEIPANLLGQEMLWQTEVAQLPHDSGYPGTGVGTKVIRFTRHENKIFMRDVSHDVRAQGDEGTKMGVEMNTLEPVIMTFDVQTEGPEKAAVIDVTQLFTSDPSEFSVKGALGSGPADPGRSYVDRTKAFETNIETRSFLTFNAGGGGNPFFFGPQGPASAIVHYSLDLLPKTPMRGRLKDSRIGYFTSGFTVYGTRENRVVARQYINRFRLEKKDPKAALSEPIKPITFYLAREVPTKWRKYLKQGVEDWASAFEKAGFKDAIVCKDAPSEKEDPNWDPEDARYSVIRWAPSEVENAMGPSIQDPRSGETLSAHVIVWNDIVKLVEDWYFSQAVAADSDALHFPFSDAKMGECLRWIICHEVGHTLGLEHNFKASTAYTIAQLRDPEFMKTHGTSASVMSYSRYDYVAQPGDGVTQFANRLGPYDNFAIEYGYKPLPDRFSSEDEKPVLDAFLARQIDDPTVRFGNYEYYGIDPTTQMENISDDPVAAGKLGLANIDRVAQAEMLPAAEALGEDYSRLAELESNLIGQRYTELFHVLALVGGVVETDYHSLRGGEVFAPIPTARQAAAVKFLVTEGFRTPTSLFAPEVVNRIRPAGLVSSVTGIQSLLANRLLSPSRIQRLQDNEALNGRRAYTVSQLVTDLSHGVWSEVDSPIPQIDVYRRSLQRSYLKLMDDKVNGPSSSGSDLRALERGDLERLHQRLVAASPRAKDQVTAMHLMDCGHDVQLILENKYSAGKTAGGFDLSFLFGAHATFNKNACWAPFGTIHQALEEIRSEAAGK